MKKKDKDIREADKLIHEAIMNEGEYLKEKLGPVTYENPEGYDIEDGFQRLLKDRAKLKEENLEYEAKSEADAVKMESAVVETAASKVREFETAKVKRSKSVRKGFGGFSKVAVIVLVAGACIAGASLQSEATRMWWMESLGWSIGNDSSTKVNNDDERDMADMPEWEAASTIEKELGIKVPKLQYTPDQCEFSDYMYETITNMAVMYYKIHEKYLTISIMAGMIDTTSSANFDGKVLIEDTLDTAYGIVSIREIKGGDNTDNTVVAEWDYQDVHYEIFGRISYGEMKKIVENAVL